jgi:hypothetical protein
MISQPKKTIEKTATGKKKEEDKAIPKGKCAVFL